MSSDQEQSEEFSLDNLKRHFENCLSEDGNILDMDKYILGKKLKFIQVYLFSNVSLGPRVLLNNS